MQLQAADALLPYAQPHLCALIVLNKEGQSRNQAPLKGLKAERERMTSAGEREGGEGVAESPGVPQRSARWRWGGMRRDGVKDDRDNWRRQETCNCMDFTAVNSKPRLGFIISSSVMNGNIQIAVS